MNKMVKAQERGTNKVCIKCNTVKSLDDFPKNGKSKGGRLNTCKECQRILMAIKRANNPKHHKEIAARNRIKCRDNRLEITKKWRADNPEKVVAYRQLEGRHHLNNAMAAFSRCKKRGAVPTKIINKEWYNFVMEEAYLNAIEKTNITGVKYEVDHIVPLNGDFVCGLHVPENIQVIPMTVNRKKHKLFDDMI